MRFHIRAIKEVQTVEHSINCILMMPDAQTVAQFLHDNKLLAISQETYTQDPQIFGDIYGAIQRHDQQHDFVVDGDSIASCLTTINYLGRDVVAINSYSNPLSIDDAVASIKSIATQVHDELTQKQQHIQEQYTHTQATYTDTKAEKLQASMTKILQDADFAQKTYIQTPDISKKLTASIEDLKKMRLSKNTEKLHEIIEKIYGYIDLMEQAYLATLPQENIDQSTSIKIPMLVRLYDKRERAYKLAQAGGGQGLYARLGDKIITLEFLLHDTQQSFIQWWGKAYRVLGSLSIIILASIVITTGVGVVLTIFGGGSLENLLGLGLVRTGSLGLALWFGYLLSKKILRHSAAILLISIAIFVCLHYTMMRLLLID